MQILQSKVDEVMVTYKVFNACRANPKREPRFVGEGARVTFDKVSETEYHAHLRNFNGVSIATVLVDQFDI